MFHFFPQPRFAFIRLPAILLCLFSLFTSSFILPPTALFQQSSVTITAVAGFDGYCKESNWFPLRVALENSGADLNGSIETRIDDYSSNTSYTYPLSLPSVSRKEVTLYIYALSTLSDLQVNFVVGGKTAASTTARLSCFQKTDRLYGVLSGSTSAFSPLGDLDPGRSGFAKLTPSDIPDFDLALQSLDALFISSIDTGPLTQAQRQALANWLSAGGRIIITGGPEWQKTAAGLGDILPVAVQGEQNLASLSAIKDFAGAADAPEGAAVLAVGAPAKDASVLLAQEGTPLVVSRQAGRGSILFLAADPAAAPLRAWDGLAALLQRLVSGMPPDTPAWSGNFKDWNAAETAAASFPSVALPSIFLLCGFIFLYILVIGPINYFILRRSKKSHLAWISIPALVIIFSAAAFLFGGFIHGNVPILSRVALVEVLPGSQQAQVHGAVGIFTPNRATLRVQTRSGYLMHPIINGYGNNEAWTVEQNDQGAAITGLRMDVAGSRSIAIDGTTSAPQFSYNLELNTSTGVAQITGNVRNDSSFTLHDAVLLLPGSSMQIGEFKPGDTYSINGMPLRSEHAGFTGQPSTSANPYSGPKNYYTGDTTIADIIGTGNYYDNKTTFQRFNLLQAALGSSSASLGRGAGIYLAGWSDQSPLQVSITGQGAGLSTLDTTLYIVALRPQLNLGQQEYIFTPSQFTWTLVDSTQYSSISPYNSYLPTGSYIFQYNLALPVTYHAVKSLTLHLKTGYTSNAIMPYLFNIKANTWTPITASNLDNYDVPNPSEYVSPAGQITLRLDTNFAGGSVQLDQSDFTLVAEP